MLPLAHLLHPYSFLAVSLPTPYHNPFPSPFPSGRPHFPLELFLVLLAFSSPLQHLLPYSPAFIGHTTFMALPRLAEQAYQDYGMTAWCGCFRSKARQCIDLSNQFSEATPRAPYPTRVLSHLVSTLLMHSYLNPSQPPSHHMITPPHEFANKGRSKIQFNLLFS